MLQHSHPILLHPQLAHTTCIVPFCSPGPSRHTLCPWLITPVTHSIRQSSWDPPHCWPQLHCVVCMFLCSTPAHTPLTHLRRRECKPVHPFGRRVTNHVGLVFRTGTSACWWALAWLSSGKAPSHQQQLQAPQLLVASSCTCTHCLAFLLAVVGHVQLASHMSLLDT